MNRILLSHIGWYPTIEDAHQEAKEMKQNGHKYRIKRTNIGCILLQVLDKSE
jgi:hypothetical protein